MQSAIAFDMSRLWLSSLRSTPRGIERVEFSLADDLARNWQGLLIGVCWTPYGIRVFHRNVLRSLLEHIRTVWSEDAPASDDDVYTALASWISNRGAFSADKRKPKAMHRLGRTRAMIRTVQATGFHLGKNFSQALPQGITYVNLGHIGFMAPGLRRALKARPDIKTVALIHDTVSLSDPQYFPEFNEAYFTQVVKRVARNSHLVLTTTHTGMLDLQNTIETAGYAPPQLGTISMDQIFGTMPHFTADSELRNHPYFVLCGTREPRKNHMMMLNVWRDMALSGQEVPKLVFVGGHGWGSRHIEDFLERCVLIRDKVVRVERLSSPGLFSLMSNARALLSPSFAEGYGLPVGEALRLGTPVLASDISVYRETTHNEATLIDPLDGIGWRTEILRLANADAMPIDVQTKRAARFLNHKNQHRSLLDWLSTH